MSVGINLGRRLKSLVKVESAVGNLYMWLVATVSISTETIKSVCYCLATLALVKFFSGSGSKIFKFFISFGFFTLKKTVS